MAETIVSAELDEEVVPSSYTSETETAPAGAGQGARLASWLRALFSARLARADWRKQPD